MSQRLAGSKRLRPHRNEAGISLLETLIAMALGLLVLAGVLQLTNQLVAGNTAMIQVTRLEQDLTALGALRSSGRGPAG